MTVPDLNPPFILSFDQKIDQEAIFKTIKLTGNNSKNGGNLILLSEEEVKKNRHLKWIHSNALPNQWIAFKLSSELEKNTRYTLSIGPGTPSTEGKRLTTSAINVNFRTYPPFTIKNVSPNTETYKSSPKGTWNIYFSNTIDQNTISKDKITVKPDCDGIAITSSGTGITIRNYSKENTNYVVTVSKDLKDIYNQSLTGKDNVTFRVGERTPHPSIDAPRGMFVYDPMISPPLHNVIVKIKKKNPNHKFFDNF
jgi:alpha-2-macroglobulin